MSADASAATREADDSDGRDEYDEMLETLDTAIEEAHRKIDSGRVYDPQNEKVRCKWIKTLAYTVNVRRQVTNDRDLQDLADRIEALEEARDGGRT